MTSETECLARLFEPCRGIRPEAIQRLSAAGSNRAYYRLTGGGTSLIGVVGTSAQENRAFLAMADHFATKGLPVPRIHARSDDGMAYLQDDLGDRLLFDHIAQGRESGRFTTEERGMLEKTLRALAHFQIKAADGFDFTVCYPQAAFNRRSVMWDLNYFKYSFLKATGIEFQEDRLEDDFERLADRLLEARPCAFMYRDFQSRNVMVKEGMPWFIDFQGGRRGPLHYDVASFLWQAKACYPPALREELLNAYLDELQTLTATDVDDFRERLPFFVFFRTLQVLGAYGFRGYFERKAHFLQSIPYAIDNLRAMLPQMGAFPYLTDVLRHMVDLPRFQAPEHHDGLLVKVYSFSYKKGLPEDNTGNGGGFVFDCRAVHNPGRYEEYKALTGRDEPVIRFLEQEGEITGFLNHVYALADASVERYVKRGFTDLMIAFGCTGGQHRSVYAAQKTAEHIHEKYGVAVQLVHREQGIAQTFTTNNRPA